MSIRFRERRLLRRRASALRAADPHLAAMLAVFAQITATEALPSTEQISRRCPRLLPTLAVVAAVAARMVRAAARGIRRSVAGCASGLRAIGGRLAGGPTRLPPAPSTRK